MRAKGWHGHGRKYDCQQCLDKAHPSAMFVLVPLQFFCDLLGFIGAFGTGPTTFWLPPLIWLVAKKPKMMSVRLHSLSCTRILRM